MQRRKRRGEAGYAGRATTRERNEKERAQKRKEKRKRKRERARGRERQRSCSRHRVLSGELLRGAGGGRNGREVGQRGSWGAEGRGQRGGGRGQREKHVPLVGGGWSMQFFFHKKEYAFSGSIYCSETWYISRTWWRSGSAFDLKSEGCGFDTRPSHIGVGWRASFVSLCLDYVIDRKTSVSSMKAEST